jgi:hypothetical protein
MMMHGGAGVVVGAGLFVLCVIVIVRVDAGQCGQLIDTGQRKKRIEERQWWER